MSEQVLVIKSNELTECDLPDGGPWYQDYLARQKAKKGSEK